MGYFLNNEEPYVIYQEAAAQPYFIDKTGILKEIFPLINSISILFKLFNQYIWKMSEMQ